LKESIKFIYDLNILTNMKLLYLLILTVLIVGCTQNIECPDGSIVTDESLCVEEEQQPEVIEPVVTDVPKVEEPVTEPQVENELTGLIQKAQDQTNYKYFFVGRFLSERGKLEPLPTYTFYVRDGNTKIRFVDNLKFAEDMYYNEVYYDGTTALASCSIGLSCDYNLKSYSINYTELESTPLKLLERVPYNAEIVDRKKVEGRDAIVVEYINEEENSERMFIDTYSGLPVELVIYTIENESEVILERFQLTKLGIGLAKTSDVTLSSEYTLLE